MKRYAISNPSKPLQEDITFEEFQPTDESGSFQEDVTFEEFQTAKLEGKTVWIADGDGPYIMQI
jgi:hypothetical protein